jgi:hypothetical protein
VLGRPRTVAPGEGATTVGVIDRGNTAEVNDKKEVSMEKPMDQLKGELRSQRVTSGVILATALVCCVAMVVLGLKAQGEQKTAVAPVATGYVDVASVYSSQTSKTCAVFGGCSGLNEDVVLIVDAEGNPATHDGVYVFIPAKLSKLPAGEVSIWESHGPTGFTVDEQFDTKTVVTNATMEKLSFLLMVALIVLAGVAVYRFNFGKHHELYAAYHDRRYAWYGY